MTKIHDVLSAQTGSEYIRLSSEAAKSQQKKPPPIENQLDTDQVIKRYRTLMKESWINLTYNPQRGLSATICLLDQQGQVVKTIEHLPVTNVPKHLLSQDKVENYVRCFACAHLTAEKGIDGAYNRVNVHFSGNGGAKSTIPFQPGLALGSVVSGANLVEMERYAEQESERRIAEEQITSADNEINILDLKIKGRKKDDNDILIKSWKSQQERLRDHIDKLSEVLLSDLPIPKFKGFNQALESPIDMGKSTFETQPRGFDSLSFNSQYISMEENASEINDKVNQSSSAISGTIGGGWGPFKAKISHSSAQGVSQRLLEIKNEGLAEGVLVINALVTTRFVRCFTQIQYNEAKLETILKAMEKTSKKSENPPMDSAKENQTEESQRFGISTLASGEKAIFMLTEAVLGGSFTGLVTFLGEKKENQKHEKTSTDQNQQTSAGIGVSVGKGSLGVGASYSKQMAERSEEDKLMNHLAKKINIEITSQGVIPKMVRDTIESEIIKHIDLNPSTYQLIQKEDSSSKSQDIDHEAEAQKNQLQKAKVQETFVNAIRGIIEVKNQQSIHSIGSLMSAYDDFSEKIIEDKGCGVPIGFHYQVLTATDIQRELDVIRAKKATVQTSA